MKQFEVGSGLTCNLEALVNTRLLVQANSGAGKSWLLRRLLEQTNGKIQHLVIDPEGEFASLRTRFDYVLAAKTGGDTLADPRVAKLLAHRLLELGASAILDIYELNPRDRVRFVRLFLEALVDAPKDLWHPVLVVLDEAHVYAPEKGDAESAEAVKALCTRGRKRGFCAVLATQRLSKLHKDAAAEANNKLIGRSALDVDMKRAGDELGFTGREQLLTLRDLDAGEFYAFGPALSRTVMKVMVGPVVTEHPKAGSKLAGVVPPAPEKVKALLPKLADLPAEAEAREKTIADFKSEIAELKRQLSAKPETFTKPAQPMRVEVPILKDAQIVRLEKVYERMLEKAQAYGESMSLLWEQQSDEAKAMLDVLRVVANVPKPPPAQVHQMPSRSQPSPKQPRPTARVVAASNGHLSGPEQRIVDAIAWLESIGVPEPEQTAVAFLAGYTVGGGAFNNPRGALRVKGFIEYVPGDLLRLTEGGRQLARLPDIPLNTAMLHESVLARLPGPEQRLLRPLLDAYPNAMTNEQLAEAANYAVGAGAFNNPRGRLRTLGLIEYPQPGSVRARSILFLGE